MEILYPAHRRSWLLGLFVQCPLEEELDTCPAREIRKLSLDDRVQIAEGVPPEVVDRFLQRHHLCVTARQKDLQRGTGS